MQLSPDLHQHQINRYHSLGYNFYQFMVISHQNAKTRISNFSYLFCEGVQNPSTKQLKCPHDYDWSPNEGNAVKSYYFHLLPRIYRSYDRIQPSRVYFCLKKQNISSLQPRWLPNSNLCLYFFHEINIVLRFMRSLMPFVCSFSESVHWYVVIKKLALELDFSLPTIIMFLLPRFYYVWLARFHFF